MRKQVTFSSRYKGRAEKEAIEWLSNLAKCFYIKKATMKTYEHETKFTREYHCRLIVEYD